MNAVAQDTPAPARPRGIEDMEVVRERSAYMRLYRAWWDGDAWYPAGFVAPEIAARMLMAGHISPVYKGERQVGWMLTPEGIKAWAWMNEPYLLRWKRNALITEGCDLLRYLVGLITFDELRVEARARMERFTEAQQKVLEALAGGDVVKLPRVMTGWSSRRLVQEGMVEKHGAGEYQITDAGRAALNGAEVGGDDPPAARPALMPKAAKAADVISDVVADDADECEGCVHRRVLDLLMESLPDARELYESIRQQEEILARLKGTKNG